ncbi:MAG: class I SAM-dependent methyltransferase [bacterium]
MKYQHRMEQLRAYYDQCAQDYRQFDEETLDEESPRHTCSVLNEITRSFAREIDVLDLGCGSGRSFHCLENVRHLTGIDISNQMLEQARSPVHSTRVRARKIELICTDFYQADLPKERFDFIYSIGMLGENTPFNAEVCDKLFSMLRPAGALFFTTVDRDSRSEEKSLKKRMAETVLPLMPAGLKEKLKERMESFYVTEVELRAVMETSRFRRYHITRHACISARWSGAHFECLAHKDAVC